MSLIIKDSVCMVVHLRKHRTALKRNSSLATVLFLGYWQQKTLEHSVKGIIYIDYIGGKSLKWWQPIA